MSLQQRQAVAAHMFLMCPLMMAASGGGAAAPAVSFSDPELTVRARGLAIGQTVRIEGLALDPAGPPHAMELERFRVFAPDARVVVHGLGETMTLPPPANVYLRGNISGRPGARVLLTVLDGGGLRGLIADGGRYWLASQERNADGPELREVTGHPVLAAGARRFVCNADRLISPQSANPAFEGPPSWFEPARRSPQSTSHTLRVAVETDYEYYQLFGSIANAVSYAADLFAYASTFFTTEVGVDFWLHHVSLWTTASDPWTQSSSGCCLFEFSRYWNNNMGGVTRSIAHFLSGKAAGGGMSWPGAMCAGSFTYNISGWGCSLSPTIDLYGGDYSFSGDLTGSFNISNPSVVWDIYAVSHEVGHHFNTPHTHCYVPPVDQCYGSETGCYLGPTSLPCPTPGAGCGTIMSYCHTLTPGMSNISLTLGLGHPWGTNPARVPALMSSYLSTMAASYPLCLAPIVFADFFEAGDASAWSSTVP